jgi:hypothetical protein
VSSTHIRLPLLNKITLEADTWYRAAVKPLSATNIVYHAYKAAAAGLKATLPGGVDWHFTRKAVGGNWDDSFVDDAILFNLILDQIDYNAGGGGSGGFSFAGMSG